MSTQQIIDGWEHGQEPYSETPIAIDHARRNGQATYRLEVRFRDGTGHNYNKLTRKKVADLTARQFASGLDRPETITIKTERFPR